MYLNFSKIKKSISKADITCQGKIKPTSRRQIIFTFTEIRNFKLVSKCFKWSPQSNYSQLSILKCNDVNVELDFYRPWVLPRHLKHVFCGAVRALVAFLAKKPKLQLLPHYCPASLGSTQYKQQHQAACSSVLMAQLILLPCLWLSFLALSFTADPSCPTM